MDVLSRNRIRIDHVLFSLFVAMMPTQLGFHTWPDAAFVLGRRIDYLSPTLFFTDILCIVFMISFLLFKIRNHPKKVLNLPSPIHHSFCIGIFITFAFIAVNIAISPIPLITTIAWLRIAECIGVVWYMYASDIPLSMVILPLSVALLSSSLLAIAQWWMQSSIGGLLRWVGERTFDRNTPGIAKLSFCLPSTVSLTHIGSSNVCPYLMRPYATFPHPNVLGGFLATVTPILWYWRTTMQKSPTVVRLGILFTCCIGVVALFLTFSRSSWVVFTLCIVFLFYESRRLIPNWIRIVSSICVVLFFFFIWSTFTVQSESMDTRVSLLAASVRMIQASPFFGIGLGAFTYRLPDMTSLRDMTFLQPVHSIYALWIAETGIVGFSILCGWVIFIGKKLCKKIVSRAPFKKTFSIPWILACIAILLLGTIDHYPLSLMQGRFLSSILIGIFFLVQKTESNS